MKIIKIFFFIILFLGCNSTKTKIETIEKLPDKPKVDSVLTEIKTEIKTETQTNGKESVKISLLRKVETALEDCKTYSQRVDNSYTECIKVIEDKTEVINDQTNYIDKLQKQITTLQDELSTWRTIKWTVYILVGVIIFALLFRMFYPVIIGILKRSAGIP